MRAGNVSLELNAVPTATVVAVTDSRRIHVPMTIMSRGHLDSAPLKVVYGVPASLEVGLAV